MSLILDAILIAIFAAFVFFAVKKGFVLTLLELVAAVLSLVLAYSFSPVVAQTTYDSFIENKMIEVVKENIDDNVDVSSTAGQAEAVLDAMPEYVVSIAASSGVDLNEIKEKISAEKISTDNIATELVEKIAQPIVIGALTILMFMILSFLFLIALKFVAKLISKLFNIPIVGTVNKLLGGVLGAIKGVIVLILICTVLRFALSGGDGELSGAISDSYVIGMLDKINPFLDSLKEMLM